MQKKGPLQVIMHDGYMQLPGFERLLFLLTKSVDLDYQIAKNVCVEKEPTMTQAGIKATH